ncbi:MAG: hypothetical protein P8019_12230 [Gammaproteobacteria bacterium]
MKPFSIDAFASECKKIMTHSNNAARQFLQHTLDRATDPQQSSRYGRPPFLPARIAVK